MSERGGFSIFARREFFFQPTGVHLDEGFPAALIENIAAPGPVLRIDHESEFALERIRVHIRELLDE